MLAVGSTDAASCVAKTGAEHVSDHQDSRARRIVCGVKVCTNKNQLTHERALEELEPKWDDCRGSPANFVKCLQQLGAIENKSARGKNKKEQTI